MDVIQSSLDAIYVGWRNYQSLLITTLASLAAEQLALQSAPRLHSIEAITTHEIGARGRWFTTSLGDGDRKLAKFSRWARPFSRRDCTGPGFYPGWHLCHHLQ
jgi:hypothetical protein